MLLGVNIDHIAVLREARKVNDPDPLESLGIVARAGADQITIHLREDRRHINDIDAMRIIENASLPVNLECSVAAEIVDIVLDLSPHRATLVPEKREEVTTEGGLDLLANFDIIEDVVKKFQDAQIEVSVFIDPNSAQIQAAKDLGVEWIELHTGHYSNIYNMLYSNLSQTPHSIESMELSKKELKKMLDLSLQELAFAAKEADRLGIKVAAGHGLNYQNVKNICSIKEIQELNIGQSIIARSVFDGLFNAIKEMIYATRN